MLSLDSRQHESWHSVFITHKQGLTLTPTKCGWISAVAGNTVTSTSHFGRWDFIHLPIRVNCKVSAPFGETGHAYEQHTTFFLFFFYTTFLYYTTFSLCRWVKKCSSHGSDWRQAAQGKCVLMNSSLLMPVQRGHGDVTVEVLPVSKFSFLHFIWLGGTAVVL